MKFQWIALASASLLAAAPANTAAPAGGNVPSALAQLPPDVQQRMLALDSSLHPQSGIVKIADAKATLNLGGSYVFLPAEEARKVLVEGWGNPPGAAEGVLGLIMPAGQHFYDDGWGAVVTYEDTGHVDDKDAASQDYDKVLADMRKGEEAANEERRAGGYPGITLVGWAQPPSYDAEHKALIWARDLKVEGTTVDTLNYDVRTLGRTGVLSMNMIDTMAHLGTVQTAATELGQVVQFDEGARYADFDASTDKLADYGLAGLVAAGAGLAVAKKAGLLGLLILFLKKGLVIVIAAVAGGWRWIKRRMGGGEAEA